MMLNSIGRIAINEMGCENDCRRVRSVCTTCIESHRCTLGANVNSGILPANLCCTFALLAVSLPTIGSLRSSCLCVGAATIPNFSTALDEILRDMGQDGTDGLRMFRLLQGDVGSGKTAVAFLGMLKAIEQGSQSCLLAPTEVLAVQHLNVRS